MPAVPISISGSAQNPRVLFTHHWLWAALLQQPAAPTFSTAVPSTCPFSAFIRGALGMCFLHNFIFTQYILTAQDNAVQYPLAFPQHTKMPQQYFSSVGPATSRSRSFTLFPSTLRWHNVLKDFTTWCYTLPRMQISLSQCRVNLCFT